MEVHSFLGCGHTEPIYQEALEQEFKLRNIPYEREKCFNIDYKGIVLRKNFFADFVCYGKIIVELKAVQKIDDAHFAQIYNYLKASDMKLGLLINFGETKLKHERILCTHKWTNQHVNKK